MAPVQAYDSFMPVVIVLCLLVARHGAALMLPHVPGRRVSRRSTRGTCITETYMYAPRSGQSLAETLIRKDGAKVDVSGPGNIGRGHVFWARSYSVPAPGGLGLIDVKRSPPAPANGLASNGGVWMRPGSWESRCLVDRQPASVHLVIRRNATETVYEACEPPPSTRGTRRARRVRGTVESQAKGQVLHV